MSEAFDSPETGASEEPARICIEGEMTVYRALEIKEALLAALAAVTTLEIDLSAVSEIDSAGVQLLLLAQRQAAGAGQRVQLASPSGAVAEVLGVLGLGDHFSLAGPAGMARTTAPCGVCA